MVRSGRVLLVPVADQTLGGMAVEPQADRLILADRCSIAAADASLIETPVCGTYLRVDGTTQLDTDDGSAVAVKPGLYQVIRKQE